MHSVLCGMKNLKYYLIGFIVGLIYRLLSATWRYRAFYEKGLAHAVNFKTKKPNQTLLFAHWHGDEFALVGFCKRSKFLTFSSWSKDGSIMTAALMVCGFDVIRGSSSKGGASALIAMIKKIKSENYYVSFAVDGPQGPRHKAKNGVHLIARKANLPIIQCLVKCTSRWDIPNTWNKTYVPKPFAKIELYFYSVPQATKQNQDKVINTLNSRTTIQ